MLNGRISNGIQLTLKINDSSDSLKGVVHEEPIRHQIVSGTGNIAGFL